VNRLLLVRAMRAERTLAENAYAAAKRMPEPFPEVDRTTALRILNSAYQLYGISRGSKETKELVRAVERAVAGQASGLAR